MRKHFFLLMPFLNSTSQTGADVILLCTWYLAFSLYLRMKNMLDSIAGMLDA